MARKKTKKNKELQLEQKTKHGILAVVFFVLAILFILAWTGNAGVVGSVLFGWLELLLGVGYFLLPLLSLFLGVIFLRSLSVAFGWLKGGAALVFLLSGLGIVELLFSDRGGLIGSLVAAPIMALFDLYAGLVLLIALFLIALLVMFNTGISAQRLMFWKHLTWFTRTPKELPDEEGVEEEEEYEDEEEIEEEYDEEEEEEESIEAPVKETAPKRKGFAGIFRHRAKGSHVHGPYTPPPLALLEKDRGKPSSGDIKANANIIKRTLMNFGITVVMDEVTVGPSVTRYALKPAEGVRLSRIIGLQNNLELALAAHPVRIEAPIPGKSLVGIEIPNTTKSTIGLSSLMSSTEFTGTDAPLPVAWGKGLSGKTHVTALAKMPHVLIAGATGAGKSVTIHALITSLLYRNGPQALKFVMVDPKRVELTLYNGIPHLLTPVITDPKKAILALKWLIKEMERRYEILESESVRDIASYHENVLAPALEGAKEQKDSRDEEQAASAKGYGEPKEESEDMSLPDPMPYIVAIIDELADIMSAYPRELEAAIVRLAQMSRAVGIHLVLSTQRPSVNIITGLIKANVPARVALQVASQVDSRTILDMSGAEKLLGAGDMLFLSGEMSKPVRLQSGFITETEVKKVVKHLKKAYEDELPDEIDFAEAANMGSIMNASLDDEGDEEDDELYEDAREAVIDAGKASTSYLQRKLRVGYARAARLMDLLEERGVIGPADGSKPREVLDSSKEYGEEEEDDD